MTDGLYFPPPEPCAIKPPHECIIISNSQASSIRRDDVDSPDLTNYASWLELQSTATIANVLYVTANELYQRRDWPSIAGRVKDAARDLRVVTREEL